MRILLIQAYLGRKEKPIYPLGLATLAAVLKDHEVKVVDPNIFDDPIGDLRKITAEFQPQLAGISLRNVDTTWVRDPFIYLSGLKDCLRAVSSAAPEAGIVIGGTGFSIWAREIMQNYPQIDCGVFLEGEETFPELANKWPDIDDVKSIFLRRNGELIFNGPREFPDVAKIPSPDWEAVPIEPYKHLIDAVGLQTKRGCALNCVYCSYPFLNGTHYRLRPPELVVDEIEKLVKEYGLERFIFADSVFNIPRNHAEAIMKEILRRKIKVRWTGWFNEKEFDRDMVELALKAGCEVFAFSPDGFSEPALKALGKNIRMQDILRVFELMKDYPQAIVGYNFFFNPPDQSFTDLLKMLFFLLKIKRTFRGRMVGFLLGSIRIEPDTGIHRRAIEEGFITEDTPMLVNSTWELNRLFYRPPNSFLQSVFVYLYILFYKFRHAVFPPREM